MLLLFVPARQPELRCCITLRAALLQNQRHTRGSAAPAGHGKGSSCILGGVIHVVLVLFRLQIVVPAPRWPSRCQVFGAGCPSAGSPQRSAEGAALQALPPCRSGRLWDFLQHCLQWEVAPGVPGVPAAGSGWCQCPLAPLPSGSSSHPAAGGPRSPSLLRGGTAFLRSSDICLLAFVLQQFACPPLDPGTFV